jgi:hypothetical protein
MSRDLNKFPQDENGEVLWRMHSSGDDLSKIREMDFSVVFSTEKQALDFLVAVLLAGHKVQLRRFKEQPDGLTWDVTISTHMAPTHLHVTEFEQLLADTAAAYGGRNDGWGCFAQA